MRLFLLPFIGIKNMHFLRALECIFGYKGAILYGRLTIDYLWTTCPFLVIGKG